MQIVSSKVRSIVNRAWSHRVGGTGSSHLRVYLVSTSQDVQRQPYILVPAARGPELGQRPVLVVALTNPTSAVIEEALRTRTSHPADSSSSHG